MMTLQEARKILDEVIPEPNNNMVDLAHMKIACAWVEIKRELDKMAKEIAFEYKGFNVSVAQREPNKQALIVVKDKAGNIQGWPHKDENSFITTEDFAEMLDHFWKCKGATMPDYE